MEKSLRKRNRIQIMKIIIPTNRDKVISTESFSTELFLNSEIVSHHNDKADGNMGLLRQLYIEDEDEDEHIVMLDDDLKFETYCHLSDKYVKSNSSDIDRLFLWIKSKLEEGYVYVGVSNRFMANTKPSEYEASAPSMIYAFNKSFLEDNLIRFDDIELCEDWHVALSVYECGGKNIFTSDWIVTDVSSGKGGLELSRNKGKIIKAMNKFKELHEDFVSIKSKSNGKQQRHITDLGMTVQWKKAYKHGLSLST